MTRDLAPFACRAEASLGRAFAEPDRAFRSPFQRDRDRIVHATAFRRLEYKTQVFVTFEGDHFRTRLTHTLEVAQIARTIARALKVDEDLAEAIALAHDLGHSAFGHAGEAALDDALAEHGGFDHNLQAFRVVTSLERRYADFDGLNLTFETLEGLAKHNGPLTAPPPTFAHHPLAAAVDLASRAPVEAQIAALADDIAYSNHDLDDGLRAGLITMEDLAEVPLAREALAAVDASRPGLESARRRHETIRRLIDGMVSGVIEETRRRLDRSRARSADDIRRYDDPVVAFDDGTARELPALRAFLRERVYHHYKVARMTLKAGRVVRELLGTFLAAPECLPDGWRERAAAPGPRATAEAARDYVAGMTDRFALDEHDRLFKMSPTR